MTEAQAWLPSTALIDGTLTEIVSATLARWGSKWISRPGRLTVNLQTAAHRSQQPEEGWRTSCGSIAASNDRERALRLAAAVLALRRPPRSGNPADTKLLLDMAADATRDLLAMLAVRFPAASGIERVARLMIAPSSLRFSVAGTHGRLFDVAIAAGAAAAARKALASPLRKPAPLTGRRTLPDALDVKVSARIGTSQISASDLESLSVNDVLVLDTKIAEPPRLAINGRVIEGGQLSLARKGASLVIRNLEHGPA